MSEDKTEAKTGILEERVAAFTNEVAQIAKPLGEDAGLLIALGRKHVQAESATNLKKARLAYRNLMVYQAELNTKDVPRVTAASQRVTDLAYKVYFPIPNLQAI